MRKQSNDKEWILKYAKTKNIGQCILCGEIGLKKLNEEKYFNKYYVEKEFRLLDLDEYNICKECRELRNSRKE